MTTLSAAASSSTHPFKKILPAVRPVLAVVAAFALGGLVMLAIGKNPLLVYGKMFSLTLGTGYGWGQVLFRATPLILTGLAVAIPFQAGLFNIGGEGQALVGIFACAAVGLGLPPETPAVIALPLCLLASMLAGAGWAGIAGLLKIRFGVSEVITSIMLNFIAAALVGYFLLNTFALPGTMQTAAVADGARLPRLSALTGLFLHSPANLSFLFSLLLAAGFSFALYQTKFGYELRAVGLNPDAARYAGIDRNGFILVSMLMAGALAGLSAANIVLGYKGYYEYGMGAGTGFLGAAVAMLANGNPLGIVLSALLFGLLDYGGLTINAQVPKEIFYMLQAAVILFVIASQKLFKS